MPVSPKPYKSRLFNYLNRQSIRFSDRIGQTFRTLKVAAQWGVQILVYPIYLAFQTGRLLLGKSAPNHVTSFLSDSSWESHSLAPETDQVINNILTSIQPWVNQLTESNINDIQPQLLAKNPLTIIPKIQGIAALIDNRNLVLVDNQNNQIIDCLTPIQQQQLDKKIIWEIAEYWRKRKNFESKSTTKLLAKIETSQVYMVSLRWFWELMEWMQTGQVAIAINLFGESEIKTITHENEQLPGLQLIPPLPVKEIITSLDHQLAILETQQPGWLKQITPIFDKISIYSSKLVNHSNNANLDSDQNHPWHIIVLIGAAIAHFFGFKSPSSSVTGETTPQKVIPSPEATPQKSLPINITQEISPNLEQQITTEISKNLELSSPNNSQITISQAQTSSLSLTPPNETTEISNTSLVTSNPQLVNTANTAINSDAEAQNHGIIQNLINAALDYFFGDKNKQPSLKTTSQSPDNPSLPISPTIPTHKSPQIKIKLEDFKDKNSEQPPQLPINLNLNLPNPDSLSQTNFNPFYIANPPEDPWLTWEDLFGEQKNENNDQNSIINPNLQLNPGLPLPPQPGISVSQQLQQTIKPQTAPQPLQNIPETTQNSIQPIESTENTIIPTEVKASHPEATPDWIETEATHVGYVQHPLEKILRWLDNIMVWVEDKVIHIWQKIAKK